MASSPAMCMARWLMGLGKIGVLVALESTGDTAKLETLGRQLAMHVAATNPLAANVADLDPAED